MASIVRRVVMALLGGLAALAMLVWLNIALWQWLTLHLWFVQASLIMAAGWLVIAAILLLLARRSGPDAVEAEARTLRDRALGELRQTFVLVSLLQPLSRVVGRRTAFAMTLAFNMLRNLAARRS